MLKAFEFLCQNRVPEIFKLQLNHTKYSYFTSVQQSARKKKKETLKTFKSSLRYK